MSVLTLGLFCLINTTHPDRYGLVCSVTPQPWHRAGHSSVHPIPNRHLLEPYYLPAHLACCAHQGSILAPDSTLHKVPVSCQLCKEEVKVRRGSSVPTPLPGQ